MKAHILTLSFLLAVVTQSVFAQGGIMDTHPNSTIFAIDFSSGQQVQVNSDAATLFKDAFIELVSNTPVARSMQMRAMPGPKSFAISQLDPQSNGSAYQLVLEYRGTNNTIYTFSYNADQNALYFLVPSTQSYTRVLIGANNANNLNNCFTYGKFNTPGAQGDQQAAAQPAADADNTAVDVDVSAKMAPPAMPDYEQPECPVDGYLWQPGYWAYSTDTNGYYWVPGIWMAPPSTGLLWTPPYWAFVDGVYAFHTGYWGNTIGFYGGINYGFGYGGVGFVGGEWRGGHFAYNTAVVHVNVTVVHNTFSDRSVIRAEMHDHASFNGRGGVIARATERERLAEHEHHVMATPDQIRNQRVARNDKSQFAAANGGRPGNLAKEKPPVAGPARGGMGANGAKNGFAANTAPKTGAGFNTGQRPAGPAGPGMAKTSGPGVNAPKPAIGGPVSKKPQLPAQASKPAAPLKAAKPAKQPARKAG